MFHLTRQKQLVWLEISSHIMKNSLGKYFNFIFSNPNMSVNATEMRKVHQLHQVTGWFNLTTLARTCGSANQPIVMSPRAPNIPIRFVAIPRPGVCCFILPPPSQTHRHTHTQTCCRCDKASFLAGARNPCFCQNAVNSRLNMLFFRTILFF